MVFRGHVFLRRQITAELSSAFFLSNQLVAGLTSGKRFGDSCWWPETSAKQLRLQYYGKPYIPIMLLNGPNTPTFALSVRRQGQAIRPLFS
jgi:hypothetical protein